VSERKHESTVFQFQSIETVCQLLGLDGCAGMLGEVIGWRGGDSLLQPDPMPAMLIAADVVAGAPVAVGDMLMLMLMLMLADIVGFISILA
jgi:hypothetical protein